MSPLTPSRLPHFSTPSESVFQVIDDNPAGLQRILETDVNLCVWRRAPSREVSNELQSLQANHLPDVRCTTRMESFDSDLRGLLMCNGLRPEAFQHWCADVEQLAKHYFPLTHGRKVTLRLETTDNDGCRRFHVDRTHLRLLCTYRGPGTEWLPEAQVDREAQLAGAGNEEILRYGSPSHLESFWVGILKGTAFPGNADHGLVHRSPPVEQSGQVRVLVCLDS